MARSGKALLAAALVMSMLVLQVAASRNLKDVLVIDEPLVTPVVAADPDDPTLGGGSPNPDGSSGGIWGNTTVDGGGAPPSQVDPEDGSPVRLYVLTQWKAGSDLKTLADLEWDRINRCKLASDGTTPRLAAGVAGANSNAFLAGGIFGSFAKVLDFASPWDCLDFVDCLSSDLAAEYLAPYETGDGGAIYAMSSIAAEQIGALAAGEVVHVALLSPRRSPAPRSTRPSRPPTRASSRRSTLASPSARSPPTWPSRTRTAPSPSTSTRMGTGARSPRMRTTTACCSCWKSRPSSQSSSPPRSRSELPTSFRDLHRNHNHNHFINSHYHLRSLFPPHIPAPPLHAL